MTRFLKREREKKNMNEKCKWFTAELACKTVFKIQKQ